MRSDLITADVLVVGAGPAGLTAATMLARHGVDVLVVERHDGTSPFPKATGVSTRTMELLRTWGVEQRVRAGAMRVRPGLTVCDTLADPAQKMDMPFGYPTDEAALAVSPTTPCYCPQDHLEPVLLEHLRAHGGRVRFGTELTGSTTGATGVHAELRDLTRRLPRPPSVLNFVEVAGAEGLFVPTSTDDRWIYGREWHPDRGESMADWTLHRCIELLRAGTGLPDLRPEILAVMPFVMGGHVATSSRAGRTFLVGDAAHRTTPVGGIGMNTAIHGAHNLGWKLAWVLRGWAGEALLDSYQAERRPIGTENVLRSLRQEPQRAGEGLAWDVDVRYRSAVVEAGPGTGTGERAPHAWVRHGGSRVSTLDLFDGRLTVLTGSRGGPWRRAVAELAAAGLPIVALSAGRDLHDEDGALARHYRLGDAGAALVRPDGYLAWRRPGPGGDARAALRSAVGLALGRAAEAPAILRQAG
ncbi:MAG: FAD-dependent oxidoreductase [Pseudonocardiales bacterium]